MLSTEGIVSSWNAGAQRFMGYVGEEILGQHFSTFDTDEDRATNLPERALRIARCDGKFEDEGWRVRKDGTGFRASVVIDAIRDAEGVLISFAKITRDITERKRAAEQLHFSEGRFRLLVQGVTDYAIYMLSPEGLFTDVVMPATSGIKLAAQARALAPKMKIILASGYAAKALKMENADVRDDEFVSKPDTLAQILKLLRT